MSSGGILSRKQKGKAVVSKSSPARDVDGTPLDDFELVHREAMMDTHSLGLPERLLVSESTRLHRREVARTTTEAQACARDGQEGARDGTPPIDFVPICFYPSRIFEEMPPLPPESLRSPKARVQTQGNVLPTRSAVGSVKRLLRANRGAGVTFLIPSEEQRLWSPSIGFQCVYESYFQDDTKLWFPIPRLVTSYARRHDAAISQFLNGSWRLAVALMVMAAEIGVTLNVRAFEELTYINTVKRRISLFTRDEQRAINASRGMKGFPDLSAMMASQLGLPRPEPVNPPKEVGVIKTAETTTAPARQDLLSIISVTSAKKRGSRKRSCDDLTTHETREISPEGVNAPDQENTAEPPKAKKRKRQPNDRPSPVREGPSLNLPLADDPDDASPPDSLQLTRKPRRMSEQGGSRLEAPPGATSDTAVVLKVAEGPVLATAGTSTSGVLMLKKVLKSDESMNFIIEKYDAALKEALANSEKLKEKSAAKGRFFRRKTAEWTAAYEEMVAKRERAIAWRKIHHERANVAEADLRIANATISTLETKTGQLQEKIWLEAESHKEDLARLRKSRTFEVTKEQVRVETEMIAKYNKRFANIRDYQTLRAPFDTMRLLQSQAFGTRKCLEALKASGRDIPQETIEMFAAQEKHFEEEALKLDAGEIPEADLTLSPLKLDSQFVDERVMVGLDLFGSNTNLIDARTASLLHTSSSPRGLHAGTLASPDRRPAYENAAFAPGRDQPAILLLSDSSAAGQEEDQGEEKSTGDQGDEVSDGGVRGATEERDTADLEGEGSAQVGDQDAIKDPAGRVGGTAEGV
ncbi:hypothetical protein N665_1078s0003 [Sinapis alba]|nr:hypothetical protein N665_1078s0003 [Sinapis alba]